MNIQILETEIKNLEKEKKKISDLLYFKDTTDDFKRIELMNKYVTIKKQLSCKREQLYHALNENKQPDLIGDEIDLYKTIKSQEINYIIKLSKSDECIGFIDYRKENFGILGNIGYGIKPEYRGNNYAFKALNLVTSDLLNNGVEDVIITAEKSNIPSIKIIENFGGILIGIENDILIYKCKLNKKKVIK